MTALVIPDIHTNWQKADMIIAYSANSDKPHDKVVFLGDYFDTFNDSPSQNFDTAIWLYNRIKDHPEDEFLLGNHDMQYIWGLELCSGYSPEKKAAIHATGEINFFREHLKLFTLVDGWLITHAGLTTMLVPQQHHKDLMSWLSGECTRAMFNFKQGVSHWTVAPGQDRGGYAMWGGLNWCDFSKFKPIEGVKQLFGHTKGYLPRYNGTNHCIDTALKHYAKITDGEIKIHDFQAEIAIGLLK